MRTLAVMLMLGGAATATLAPATSKQSKSAPVPASAPRVEVPTPEPVPLSTWSDLVDRPCRRLGRIVRVQVQVESHPTDWDPYLTRFGTGQFEALQGWADDQYPWMKADFDAPQVRVFMRKGSAAARVLAAGQAEVGAEHVAEALSYRAPSEVAG